MNTLLLVALLGVSWEPPPPRVAQALEVAPSFCVYAHGFGAGILATRDGHRPAMGWVR